jgi:RimJ/RimL family protein N-acetyltransferase
MEYLLETPRFLLREIVPSDVDDLFELDSNPAVHEFLGNQPIQDKRDLEKVIASLQRQYAENGIGRWAVIDKQSKEFVGWAGLKFERELINGTSNYYDLGYRIKQKYWGKGIATECAQALINYALDKLELREIYAITDPSHEISKKILRKVGFSFVERFDYEGEATDWFEFSRN